MKNRCDKQKTNSKIVDLNSTASIITLTMNGLSVPTKRQKLDKKKGREKET